MGENVDAAREGTMEEHENDVSRHELLERLETAGKEGGTRLVRKGDLVVELTGFKWLDLKRLALLLTAQQQVHQEDRAVWLAGLPSRTWQSLHALGLGRLFKPFPASATGTV